MSFTTSISRNRLPENVLTAEEIMTKLAQLQELKRLDAEDDKKMANAYKALAEAKEEEKLALAQIARAEAKCENALKGLEAARVKQLEGREKQARAKEMKLQAAAMRQEAQEKIQRGREMQEAGRAKQQLGREMQEAGRAKQQLGREMQQTAREGLQKVAEIRTQKCNKIYIQLEGAKQQLSERKKMVELADPSIVATLDALILRADELKTETQPTKESLEAILPKLRDFQQRCNFVWEATAQRPTPPRVLAK